MLSRDYLPTNLLVLMVLTLTSSRNVGILSRKISMISTISFIEVSYVRKALIVAYTLIPEMARVTRVNDYMPISLLSCTLALLSS